MTKKRTYNSESRDAQALKTKTAILESAKTLFQEEGFDRVTIEKLAKAASVSMPTIYALFKSKRGVLQALIDEAMPSDHFTALVDDAMHEASIQKRMAITAKMARQIYEAESELMDILRGASVVAPEFKELEKEREERRYDRQLDFVKALMKEKALAKGLTLEKARDILWAMTGRDLYRLFVVERGWSSEQYETWLTNALGQALL